MPRAPPRLTDVTPFHPTDARHVIASIRPIRSHATTGTDTGIRGIRDHGKVVVPVPRGAFAVRRTQLGGVTDATLTASIR